MVAQAYDRDRVLADVATLLDRARSEEVPVVGVQDDDAGEPGSEAWRLVDPLGVHTNLCSSGHRAPAGPPAS